jgi:hypothetical protein
MEQQFTMSELRSLIESIVEEKINQRKRPCRIPKDYHTMPEVKSLIHNNIDAISDYFGSEWFELPAFQHFLRKMTCIRPGDDKVLGNGKGATKWKSQVCNVIRRHPLFERSNVVGTYRLNLNLVQQSTIFISNQ